MTIDTTKLRELAQEATQVTPGPWHCEEACEAGCCHALLDHAGERILLDEMAGSAARFIAAANPATVLALLDELTRTQGSVAIASAALSAAEREVQKLRTIEAAARNLVKVMLNARVYRWQ